VSQTALSPNGFLQPSAAPGGWLRPSAAFPPPRPELEPWVSLRVLGGKRGDGEGREIQDLPATGDADIWLCVPPGGTPAAIARNVSRCLLQGEALEVPTGPAALVFTRRAGSLAVPSFSSSPLGVLVAAPDAAAVAAANAEEAAPRPLIVRGDCARWNLNEGVCSSWRRCGT